MMDGEHHKSEVPMWYAVWTRSNHEALAVAHLGEKRIDAYLPALEVPSRRRDRSRTLRRPLFPGYFFVRSTLQRGERIDILRAPGVVAILGAPAAPQAVPDWQIRSVQIAVASRHPLEILYDLVPGRRIRVETGPLAGIEGVVVSAPGGSDRLVVSVDILGRSVAVKLPCAAVNVA